MFEENGKYDEELLYCKSVTSDGENKHYILDDGRSITLPKDYKICSDITGNKIKIESNGKYGFIVLYDDMKQKELDNDILDITNKYDRKKEDIEYIYSNESRSLTSKVELANKSYQEYKRVNNTGDIENELMRRLAVLEKILDTRNITFNDKEMTIKYVKYNEYGYNKIESLVRIDGELVFEDGHFKGETNKEDILKLIDDLYENTMLDYSLKMKECLDNKEKELNEIEKQEKEDISKIKEDKEIGYKVFEPKYTRVCAGEDALFAEDESYIYIYDNGGFKHLTESKDKGYTVINEDTYFIDNKVYGSIGGVFGTQAGLYDNEFVKFLDVSRHYMTVKEYEEFWNYKSNQIAGGADPNSFKSKSKIYPIEDGIIGNPIEYEGYFSKPTNEKDIVYTEEELINIKSGKRVDCEKFSDFKNGYAFGTASTELFVVDKDLNVNYKDFDLYYPIDSEGFKTEFEEGYITLKKYIEAGEYEYSYCDIKGNVILGKFYNTMEDAKKELTKYKKFKVRLENSLMTKLKNSFTKEQVEEKQPIVEEPKEEVKTVNSDIYELESIISKYLERMQIHDLDVKFKVMKKNYEKTISSNTASDIEARKNFVFNNSLTSFDLGDKALLSHDDYKRKLTDFKNEIEDRIYFVDILEKLNSMKNINMDNRNTKSDDDVLSTVYSLFELYNELNPELRDKNINAFKKLVDDDKKYIEDYLFRRVYSEKCLYNSYEEWKRSFILKTNALIYQFKSDYDLQVLDEQKTAPKKALETITDNRFHVGLVYIEEINNIIEEIESITKDEDILSKLDKYKDIKIDYSKSAEENIKDINTKLAEVLKLQKQIEFIYGSREYSDYNSKIVK